MFAGQIATAAQLERLCRSLAAKLDVENRDPSPGGPTAMVGDSAELLNFFSSGRCLLVHSICLGALKGISESMLVLSSISNSEVARATGGRTRV
jgi:hypothetical protein